MLTDREVSMSLTSKLKSFLSSPKGQQIVEKGKREMSKPQNQQKIRKLLDKNRKR